MFASGKTPYRYELLSGVNNRFFNSLKFSIMAILNKGINGAFSGTIGDTVGSSWRQIDYIKSRPKPSKKPATVRQLAQQAKFALAIAFLQPMKWVVNIGFNDRAKGRSTAFNQALQLFMQRSITGDYPDFEIDFSSVTLSRGGLDKLLGLSVSAEGPSSTSLSLSWRDLSAEPEDAEEVVASYADDRVYVLLYNRTEDLFTTDRSSVRADGGLELELPDIFEGHELHVWAFARHRDGVQVSSSQYAGSVVLGEVPMPDPEP